MKKLLLTGFLIASWSASAKATPILVSATGNAGDTVLVLTFSEPVYSTPSGAGSLTLSDFVYADGNAIGASALISMPDADGSDSVVVVHVDSAFVPADFGSDTIAPASTAIFDVMGNAAPTTAVAVVPEPRSAILFGLGLMWLGSRWRREGSSH